MGLFRNKSASEKTKWQTRVQPDVEVAEVVSVVVGTAVVGEAVDEVGDVDVELESQKTRSGHLSLSWVVW